jgi:hypothetical protein
MNRREKLIGQALGPDINDAKVKMLDTTVRIILGDMGEHYYKMWEVEGPGVMVFQPMY